jgi:hypothetical protein
MILQDDDVNYMKLDIPVHYWLRIKLTAVLLVKPPEMRVYPWAMQYQQFLSTTHYNPKTQEHVHCLQDISILLIHQFSLIKTDYNAVREATRQESPPKYKFKLQDIPLPSCDPYISTTAINLDE